MLNTTLVSHKPKNNINPNKYLSTINSSNHSSPGNRKPYPDKIYSNTATKKRSAGHNDQTFKAQDATRNPQHLLKRNGYSVNLLESFKQMDKANQFLKRRYASKGYLTESITTDSSFNPNQVTFEASNEQHLFGTLALTIDSNEGLLASKLYGNEINTFRAKGRKSCELSKFASSPQSSSKEAFASLFHLAYIYAYVLHNVKDAFIEINPRHAFFYKRMLGFRQIGEERICERVNAPAVLLHLDLDYMSTQISTLAGQANQKSRSIYPCFLPKLDEKRLTKKIHDLLVNHKTRTDTNLQLA